MRVTFLVAAIAATAWGDYDNRRSARGDFTGHGLSDRELAILRFFNSTVSGKHDERWVELWASNGWNSEDDQTLVHIPFAGT